MKLLDTTFLIDMIRGEYKTREILDSGENLVTTQINMFEIVRGLFTMYTQPSKVLDISRMFQSIGVLPLDDAAVIKASEISANLMKKGAKIGDCDCLIAGIALSHNIDTIITRNVKDFSRITGLKVEGY